MPHVLLIEDDPALVQTIRIGLAYEGFRVTAADNGVQGLHLAQTLHPDLILLDWMLPGIDGLTLCRRLRQSNDAPIVMLTARDAVTDRVSGLDAGADDYVTKPVHLAELAARIRARLRHLTPPSNDVLIYADLSLDIRLFEAVRQGRRIALTVTEYKLLSFFLRHSQQVLTKEQILEEVWGYDGGSPNLVEQYVRSLRRKIGDPPLIQTQRGTGYILREEC